jgi:Spy/CpxP family protein refolding chaperone
MKTRSIALSQIVSGLLVSGLTFSVQAQVTQQGPPARQHMRQNGDPAKADLRLEQRMAQDLSLSAEQQNKVHAHLADSRVQSQGLHEKMGALHTSLTAAIKAGDEGQIDRISQDVANLHQQQIAIHAKTTAKIYSSLTADQRAKVGDNLGMLGGGEPGFGPGFGPGLGGGRGGAGPRGRGPGGGRIPQ